jgi:hypothetical protein
VIASRATLHRPFADDPEDRRRFGRYYTPAALVDALHRLLAQALERAGLRPEACALVDPACGFGAFLAAPPALRFRARLGLDLDARALSAARRLCPGAALLRGDAYGAGLDALTKRLADGGPVAVIGNPPYIANSALLRSGRYREVRDALLPFAREVPRGTSIRDDYALFFGVADRLVEAGGGAGAIAYVTSDTFVDNFLYAPMRGWLLSRYRLHAVVELGPKLFEGTKVSTALSAWVREPGGHGARPFGHLRLSGEPGERLAALGASPRFARARPHGEALLLNAPSPSQSRELAAMRAAGDRIGSVFAVTFTGLKTRFDELLADDSHEALERRMKDFFAARSARAFALRHGIPTSALVKLEQALRARSATAFDPAAIRPFARYAGVRHRFRVPESAMAFAYVDPALIPRGDHRFRGDLDPHVLAPKLVFNVRETPLSAAVVAGPTCIHDYRHSRFAPLFAPQAVVRAGRAAARPGAPLGGPALNLAPEWARAALALREPADLLYYLAAVVNSRLVQEGFAPLCGESEELPVPRLSGRAALRAGQELADAARASPPGASLPERAEKIVSSLYGL